MARSGRGVWIGGVATVALAVAGVVGWTAWRSGPGDIDPATGCARRTPPAAHVIALVDVAGAYDPRERRRAAAALRAARAGASAGGRVTVAAPSDLDPASPAILFSRCLPAPDDAHASRAFADAFRTATDTAVAGRAGDRAPITDAVRQLAASPTAKAPAQRRVLVIVSDMMEHRPGVFSLFAAGATFETFTRSEAGRRPPADLSGVEVQVTQLDRTDRTARQQDARVLFWRPYFEAAGARDVSWAP